VSKHNKETPSTKDDLHIIGPPPGIAIESIRQTNWGEDLVGVPQIWQQTQGEGVRVMVLDTGIDIEHPDFKDNFKYGFNISATPHTHNCQDENGHGSNVASIIAANGQVTGVAPKADLFMAKILDDSGRGDSDAIIDGLKYALRVGVDVVSMSLGTHTQPSAAVLEAIREADALGVIIVCAAGNEGRDIAGDSVGWPAMYVHEVPNIIVVGAVDPNTAVPSWSSKGQEVTVGAPGVNVYGCAPHGKYNTLSGSSQATPFVAGVICLMIAHHRKDVSLATGILSPKEIKHLIEANAKKNKGILGRTDDIGYGLVSTDSIIAASVKE
jgi:subtilisin